MLKKIAVEVVSLSLICVVLLLLKAIYPVLPAASPAAQLVSYQTVEQISADVEPVDINLATALELQAIKGVGQAIAQRIVSDRQANGYYHHIAEIKRVGGIGDKTFARMSAQIIVNQRHLAYYLTY